MTIIERLNKEPNSIFLFDNGLISVDINHEKTIEFIFESYPYNNETEFSDDEKKELGMKPNDSVILKETFRNIKILDIAFSSKDVLNGGEILSVDPLPDNIIVFDFLGGITREYYYIKFQYEKFEWEIVDVIDLDEADKKYHQENNCMVLLSK